MAHRRYIFLDIDGVLNTGNHRLRQKESTGRSSVKNWCPEACRNITRLSMEFDADIIISSNWKDQYELEELKQHFEKNGVPSHLIKDLTPSEVDRHEGAEFRGEEIQQWLDDHAGPETSFLIIDDNDLEPARMESHLVQVDPENGFADSKAMQQARKILRNGRLEKK